MTIHNIILMIFIQVQKKQVSDLLKSDGLIIKDYSTILLGYLHYSIFYLFIFSFFIFFSDNTAISQTLNARFERILPKDGLRQSSITSIVQDKDGFIWLGTYNGLYRYDGYSFKFFQNDPKDSSSLSFNNIRSLCVDSTGFLWVGTWGGGLNRYDPDKESFTRFVNNPYDKNSIANNLIRCLYVDKTGTIWIGTWGGGVDKLKISGTKKGLTEDESDDKIEYEILHYKEYLQGSTLSKSLKITDILIDSRDFLWICSGHGISRINRKEETFKNYTHDPNNEFSVSGNDVSTICEDNDGNIWVGTWRDGLNLYDPKIDGFVKFLFNQNNEHSTSSNMIMDLYCENSGEIWIGTWGGGLNRIIKPFNLQNGSIDKSNYLDIQFHYYKNNSLDQYSISSDYIYSIFRDFSGILWFGTEWHGLNKLDKNKLQFLQFTPNNVNKFSLSTNVVLALELDKNDNLWIGTLNGLYVMERKSGKVTSYYNNPQNPGSISSNFIRSVIQDNNGNIWLGTLNGLNFYDSKYDKFINYSNIINISRNIYSVYEDTKGLIWIGTNGRGLFCYDPVNKKTENYVNNPSDPNSISGNTVWAICEDSFGKIWIGTELGGLCELDSELGKITRYMSDNINTNHINNNKITSLFNDKKNNLWIGTTSGVNKLIRSSRPGEKNTFVNYTTENGLPSNQITGIIEDNDEGIWVFTNIGISKFDDSANEFKNYGLCNGLQDNEFSLNAVCFDKNRSEILIGGSNGLSVFFPDRTELNLVPPTMQIVGLKILNHDVEIGQKINNRFILDKSVIHAKEIVLTHKEYNFTFEFSALHYSSPEENQFAFKLKGFDPEEIGWNYVGKQRTATYTNLPPGNYTFMVIASNSNGVWTNHPATIDIKILAPWWKTFAFKIIGLLLIILILFLIYRLRLSILEKQKNALTRMVHERTDELSTLNALMEERQEEIYQQNAELNIHRERLESLVEERTSELLIAKNKAEESDRLKSAFLANMSHEIRTPMNAIIGFSNLLNNKELSEEEKNQFIETINSNADTLLTLINDILDISMIDANQLHISKTLFCIDDVLHELERYYQIRKSKDLEITLLLPQKTTRVFIFSDAVRFRQILTNLLSNALKYTEKGKITFGYVIEKKYLKFFVSDTGFGIPKEELENIFNYFHKVEPIAKKYHRGAGIGLSICKKLAEILGGKIWVESELGKGSIFYFTIKKTDKDYLKEENIKPQNESDIYLSGMNILVAEDVSNNYELIEFILRKHDVNIVWLRDGQQLVDYVSKNLNKHQLILMDIKMPVLDGNDACKIIKEMNTNIPIIAVTAFAQEADKEKFLNNGFDAYISKPIKSQDLIQLIAEYYPNTSSN